MSSSQCYYNSQGRLICPEVRLGLNSHRPDGVLAFTILSLLSQGGGVFVNGGTVTFDNCNIHDNHSSGVRAFSHATTRHFPIAPIGKSADVYASTLAGGVWVASWWRQWVRARILNFPRPGPHCPHGMLAFLLAFAGRWRQRSRRHGDVPVVRDPQQSSYIRERSCFELSTTFSPLPRWDVLLMSSLRQFMCAQGSVRACRLNLP